MPPAPKRDCSVIVFDLNANKTDDSSPLKTLLKISAYNYYSHSKNLTKLILFNSTVTENRLNARKPESFKYINEVDKEVTLYNHQRMYEAVAGNDAIEGGNWLEALYLALKNYEDEYEHIAGIVTNQILFLTNLQSPCTLDEDLIDQIVLTLKQLNIFLYIVGPNVKPTSTIRNEKDIKSWMGHLSTESNDNLKIIKKIISRTDNTIVCDYAIGLHLFFAFKNSRGSQPWKVPLSIGSKIEIPAQTMKILNDEVKIKLTKRRGTIREQIWVDAEDETIEFDKSEVITGISRHGKFVQLPDPKMFQVENPRGFHVLCFTDSTNVPEVYMRGSGCYCVLPNETNEAFNILVDCLAEQNKYVIARRVYNNNYLPRIVVLVPKPEHKPKCFFLTTLPYADNVCFDYREGKIENLVKTDFEGCEDVYKFLDSLDVDGNMKNKVPLGVNMMRNVNSLKIINKAVDKSIGQHLMLQDIDLDLLQLGLDSQFESAWPDRTLEKIKMKKSDEINDSDDDFDW